MDKFKCPGRTRESAILDFWTKSGKCAYCGSIHPDEFFKLINEGKEATAIIDTKTFYFDKNTKLCHHHLNKEQQKLVIFLYKNKMFKIKRGEQF